MIKQKRCVKGLSCGFSCISKKKRCSEGATKRAAAALNMIVSAIQPDLPPRVLTDDPEMTKKLGEGVGGEVYLTPQGTAYKKPIQGLEIPKSEVEIMIEASKTGVAPRVLGLKNKGESGVEMEFLSGHRPLKKILMDDFDDKPRPTEFKKRTELMESFAGSISKLHKKGILHLDLHGNNLMVAESGQVKIIDYGMAKKINTEALTAKETALWAADVFRVNVLITALGKGRGEMSQVKSTGKLSDLYAKTNNLLQTPTRNDKVAIQRRLEIYNDFIKELNQ